MDDYAMTFIRIFNRQTLTEFIKLEKEKLGEKEW